MICIRLCIFAQQEKEVLASVGAGKHTIMRIALDETETLVLVEKSNFSHHMLMLHLNVFFRAIDGSVTEHSVAVPPYIIEDQSTECVLDALQDRFGKLVFSSGPTDCVKVIILNSDSHKALIRLGKHMTESLAGPSTRCITVHGRCQMHQYFSCLARMVKGFDLINGMFCATCLLHRGATMKGLQKAVHADIKRIIKLSYAPPREEDKAYNRALLTYLDQMDVYQTQEYPHVDYLCFIYFDFACFMFTPFCIVFDHSGACIQFFMLTTYQRYEDPDDGGKPLTLRQNARLRLLENTCCKWSPDTPLMYYSRPGALSDTLGEAADELFKYLHDGFLMTKPPVPALNRWNKVHLHVVF